MTSPSERSAHIVGLGLIGASVALALAQAGWRVTGSDLNSETLKTALSTGLVDGDLPEPATRLFVVATPAGDVVDVARSLLENSADASCIVTDVAGVKTSIVEKIRDARFIGGHPMAGSEQRGLAGARADLFKGCTWILTPTSETEPDRYGQLHGYLREIDANVVAVSPGDHDRLVALASHVPHIVAGALMNEASVAAQQDAVLLQMAAGGFRDMTRVAAGDPSIWPEVLFENRAAVTQALRALEQRLQHLRQSIESGDRTNLESDLIAASVARRALPGRAINSSDMSHLRVVLSDEPGQLATITKTASELGVNIFDIEIAHGIEGRSGTLLLAIDREKAGLLTSSITSLGFSVVAE